MVPCLFVGRDKLPPKGTGRSRRTDVHLRLPIGLRNQLLAHATDAGVSLNAYCETALSVYLEFLQTETERHP